MKQKRWIELSKPYLMLAIPFLLTDVAVRILTAGVNYFQIAMLLPTVLFTLSWVGLFVGITMNLKRNTGRIVYGLCFAVFFIMYLVHGVYFPYTGFFFSFSLLFLAGEGSAYILDTVKNAEPFVWLGAVVILASFILVMRCFPKNEKTEKKRLLYVLGGFVLLHLITPLLYGKANDDLQWDSWRNPRNVYENFNDANKNMKICGLYEYTMRDFYVTFLKPEEEADAEELAFLEETYQSTTTHVANGYTGRFAGKNVIVLQLEGIDSWLLSEEDMPNLWALRSEALNFDNHYSYYNGGGSTFNSELAVNTGFITPISYIQNAYSFNKNVYPGSLPALLKEQGYRVNAFHMNTGEYYSRELNYLNWGYDAYHSLLDDSEYSDASYELDRELILNESFYNEMFCGEEPFMHYIITYTPHTPFSGEGELGQMLAEERYGDDVPELSEEEYARMFAAETDKMIGLLMEALEENGLLEDTIIVAFADHYLYTLNDKTILDKYKETKNHLINYTPFFVWSKGQKAETFSKANSQLDILPTLLNLLGIAYTEEYYIGRDILDDAYGGYVFFSDYSWLDGTYYVENGKEVTVYAGDGETPENISEEYLEFMNSEINRLIRQNDLTLKYNFFKN